MLCSDDVSLWLRRRLSGTIDRLRSVRVLPWKCGLTVDIAGIDGAVQLLLQDVSRTDSLLLFLAGKSEAHDTVVLDLSMCLTFEIPIPNRQSATRHVPAALSACRMAA